MAIKKTEPRWARAVREFTKTHMTDPWHMKLTERWIRQGQSWRETWADLPGSHAGRYWAHWLLWHIPQLAHAREAWRNEPGFETLDRATRRRYGTKKACEITYFRRHFPKPPKLGDLK